MERRNERKRENARGVSKEGRTEGGLKGKRKVNKIRKVCVWCGLGQTTSEPKDTIVSESSRTRRGRGGGGGGGGGRDDDVLWSLKGRKGKR